MVTRIEYLKAKAFLKTREKREGRKQRTAPPPTVWWRSKNGIPFRIRKTSKINSADEWLFRCDFGNIVGNSLVAWPDLERNGCTPLDEQPDDWTFAEWRQKSSDIAPEAVVD
jgi:hypothetical protein